MGRLYLHQVQPVERDGKTILEKLSENPQQDNLGVKYRIDIRPVGDHYAITYGWQTGYAGGACGGDAGIRGRIYAPLGFKKGELAFVNIDDPMLEVSTMKGTSLQNFLHNIGRADLEAALNQMQGFSLVGIIEYDFRE